MISPGTVVRALAAAMLMALPLASPAPAAAQAPPGTPSLPAEGVGGEPIVAARASIGTVKFNNKRSAPAWIAGPGIVVTAAASTRSIGASATFTAVGSERSSSCYVAVIEPPLGVAVLRCVSLATTGLAIDLRYPATGTPVFLASGLLSEQGVVLRNDVDFMGGNHLQFSFDPATNGLAVRDSLMARPVLTGEGKVVSTLLIAPEDGGPTLGSTPKDLSRAVSRAVELPDSFAEAAIMSVASRALIPGVAGLVLGIAWGAFTRNGTMLWKTVGLGAVGVLGAVAYSMLTLLAIGPETLIG